MTPPLALTLTFDGHRLRMAGTPERPEWVAKDVCRVLGLTTHNAGQGVPEAEKGHCALVTLGGPQELVTVTEGGLYRLVARSRKPSAARFQSWLFNDVLPSIRKHGCYPPPSVPILPVVNLRDPLQLAAITAQALQLVAELEPKAAAHDRLSAARGDVCLQDAGRILGRQPNLFVARLIEDGVLFRGAHGKPEPAHQWRDAGYFRVRITEDDGLTFVQTMVTPRGVQWLAGRYPADQVPIVALERRPSEASH